MSALPVTIVRPKPRWSDIPKGLVVGLPALALRAWVVMLLAPVVHHALTPSYWQCLAACVAVGTLIGNQSEYRIWSREATS